MTEISRQQYADLYGPTVGDKIRLGDTDLYVEIEKDLRSTYGDELQYGGGKTLRDGMGSDNLLTQEAGCLDLVITNVTVLDPYLGVVKADVGLRNGRIVGLGKAGNPATMQDVTPGLATGTATDAISGEHLILTAGGMDTHVHYISPQQVFAALSNGITTLWGGGIGPTDGTNGVTSTNGPWNLEMMLRAIEGLPINVGLCGKGNSSGKAPLVEQLKAGAAGFKIHEDYGSTPGAIHACLSVADEFDVSVAIHTDTLNESGYVEDTIAAFDGRTIHTYHSEGAGGGHAPDLLKVVGQRNILPSSTNPTLPCGVNSVAELFDMIMVCHNLNPKIPSDVAFAESRVRGETIVAESVLHDMGAISMIGSDSQAMGRIGETFLRAFQTADLMKQARGKLPEDAPDNDNFRVLRYLAKVTINPAIAAGVAHTIGSLQPGKVADLVLWSPAFFGAKPKMVLKGGMIVWSNMGDPNASLPTPQPTYYRPMFGAFGSALPMTNITFVSQAAYDAGVAQKNGLARMVVPVTNTRVLGKEHMVRNDFLPKIEVNPETFAVTVDGVHATVKPPKTIALNQLYFFS
ncbi:MAG: urease subunit alpha [Gemmatimonas sp.]|nr:urease subunit alpha [Gemmatimonas sp.]